LVVVNGIIISRLFVLSEVRPFLKWGCWGLSGKSGVTARSV